MMPHKVLEVISFSDQTYGKFGNHRCVAKIQTMDKVLQVSAFMKVKPTIGDIWVGEVKSVEKEGKTYLNFEFERKTQAPQTESRVLNMLEFKVIPLLNEILSRLPEKENGYPEMNDSNDASPFN